MRAGEEFLGKGTAQVYEALVNFWVLVAYSVCHLDRGFKLGGRQVIPQDGLDSLGV